MRHLLVYVIFVSTLFLGSTVAAKDSVISFLSDVKGDYDIIIVDLDGEIIERIETDLVRKAALTWSPDRNEFAYSSNAGGNLNIFKMDINNKKSFQLTVHEERDFKPDWSPNGKWITFISDRNGPLQLFRIDADGANLIQLTDKGDCGIPAWSPDSQQIAVDIEIEDTHAIYVMNPEGKQLKQVTGDLPLFAGLSWSPDGERLAFLLAELGLLGGIELCTMDIKAHNNDIKRLTHLGRGHRVSNPAWSPDGKWIAYGLIKVEEFPNPMNGFMIIFGSSTLYVIDSEGVGRAKELQKVANLTDNHKPEWISRDNFSVSPDENKLRVTWSQIKKP